MRREFYGKMKENDMLTIKNLKAGYGGTEVLRGVDLKVNPGEIVALIGPNGAGKSTVLKSIFGLADIYGGKIGFKGRDITGAKTYELIKSGISFVPQGRQVFSRMTVAENLEMGAFIMADKDEIGQALDDIFEKFPVLREKRKILAGNLSGGQQQLLAIARALIQSPRLFLMDEPSLGLSPKTAKEIFEKIIAIRNERVAFLIVEQNAKQAVSIADRTYVLENGKIAMEGDKSILQNEKIRDIYFGGDAAL